MSTTIKINDKTEIVDMRKLIMIMHAQTLFSKAVKIKGLKIIRKKEGY